MKFKFSDLKWINIGFLSLTVVGALIGAIWSWSHLTMGHLILLIVSYSISNLLITVGYHRYFAHRAYKIHPVVEWTFLLLGSGSFQGSALQWATDHRRHHSKVDSSEDPYSIRRGFFFAHLGWLLVRDPHHAAHKYPPDLMSRNAVVFQHRFYVPLALVFGFGLPAAVGATFGLGLGFSFLVGGVIRTVLSQHSTFLINSAAHTFGSQPYTDANSARDSFWLAFLTFGEGYHNFHHIFQMDYRNGVRWYHWDPSKWMIRALALVGLASKLVRVPEREILRARLEMQLKRAANSGANCDRLNDLRERIHTAHARFLQLRDELRRDMSDAHNRAQQRAHLVYTEKRAELELAKAELRGAIQAWNAYVQSWCRLSPVRA